MQISLKENRKTNKNIQSSHIWLILLFFSDFRYLSWTKLKLLRFALSLRTQSPKIEMFQQVCFSVVTRTSSLLTSLHYLCSVYFWPLTTFLTMLKSLWKQKLCYVLSILVTIVTSKILVRVFLFQLFKGRNGTRSQLARLRHGRRVSRKVDVYFPGNRGVPGKNRDGRIARLLCRPRSPSLRPRDGACRLVRRRWERRLRKVPLQDHGPRQTRKSHLRFQTLLAETISAKSPNVRLDQIPQQLISLNPSTNPKLCIENLERLIKVVKSAI